MTICGPFHLSITVAPGGRILLQLRNAPSLRFGKEVVPRADAFPVPSEQSWKESPRAVMLRTMYRCEMCRKSCFIPCRLTASEFRQMERDASGASLHEDAERE
jgi:hypothetical protein